MYSNRGLEWEKKSAQVGAFYMRWDCFVTCWCCLVCSHWQDVLPSLAVSLQLLAQKVHQPALSWWLLPAFGTINVFLFWSRVGECLCSKSGFLIIQSRRKELNYGFKVFVLPNDALQSFQSEVRTSFSLCCLQIIWREKEMLNLTMIISQHILKFKKLKLSHSLCHVLEQSCEKIL